MSKFRVLFEPNKSGLLHSSLLLDDIFFSRGFPNEKENSLRHLVTTSTTSKSHDGSNININSCYGRGRGEWRDRLKKRYAHEQKDGGQIFIPAHWSPVLLTCTCLYSSKGLHALFFFFFFQCDNSSWSICCIRTREKRGEDCCTRKTFKSWKMAPRASWVYARVSRVSLFFFRSNDFA
jgi:hypothetical protein